MRGRSGIRTNEEMCIDVLPRVLPMNYAMESARRKGSLYGMEEEDEMLYGEIVRDGAGGER